MTWRWAPPAAAPLRPFESERSWAAVAQGEERRLLQLEVEVEVVVAA